MADKIRSGEVPGVSDPAMAKDIVVKGTCTYDQAVNIAKAGTLDSVKFDLKTQSVSCSITCGFSFWALRQKIWDSVMFYNYLQVAMSGPRKAGTSAQYKQAANAFFEVIDKYEPECIIVWGKRLWNNMPNERWQDSDDIVVDGNHIATGYYLLSNGKRAKVVAVYHPAGGYSWKYWHKVIQGLLASI